MTDSLTAARRAREILARALQVLQKPGLSSSVGAATEPLAAALRALGDAENGAQGAMEQAAPEALESVRSGLAVLQELSSEDPTLGEVTAQVARSLGLIHGLTELRLKARGAAAPESTRRGTAAARPDEVGRPAGALRRATVTGAEAFDAELGAHSPTNFYKGLGSDDVLTGGGIFVATYRVPDVGKEVILRLSLPGGYEFLARGVVRWSRSATEVGPETPPGFGAVLTDVAPEARELIQRYVRNRDPILHDEA